MTKFTLSLSLVLLTTFAFSQNDVNISGQVKDKFTKENLNYCSVVILDSKDSIISGAVTNDKGYFFIPVKPNKYKFVLSFVGYKNDTISTGYVNSDKFLGTYYISPDSKMMDGVTVKSSSRENTIDKDIQIVTSEMRLGATDTKDLLSKVSGVSYDRYNNSVKVDNNSNIVILADGVEKNLDYIQNLSPDRIKKIEIIRDPGGRYGLEGYSAIVNVILNKNYVGSELFMYDQALFDVAPQNKDYYLPINRISASYNYTYNKINVYGSINNRVNRFALNTDTKTIYENDSIVYERPTTSSPNTISNNFRMNYTVGVDYYINPKHTISLESNIHNFPNSSSGTEQLYETTVEKDGAIIDSYNFSTNSKNDYNQSNNSVFYIGKLSNKDRLDVSLTYSTYNDDYKNEYIQYDTNGRIETGSNNSQSTRLSVEYTRDFNSKLSTQFGYGNYWKQTDNKYTIQSSSSKDQSYSQTNTRHKFYGYASYNINKKISTKVGIAGETSNVIDNNQNNDYFIFQPLLDFRYKVNDKLSFKLKYRSRSNYPSMEETNPFVNLINPRTVSVGNPYLKPSVTHKISLKASVLQGLFSVEPYYHFSNNYIGQTGKLRSDGIFEFTYDNIGFYEEKGVETNFTIPFGKLFVWQNSFSFYNSSIKHDGKTNSLNDWRANSELIFMGLKNDGIILLNYQRSMSKNITSLGYDRNENDYWLLLVQQPFLKKSLSVMVGYFLPINFGANYNQDNFTRTNGYEQTQNTDISLLKNMLIVKVTYRFNKGKIKKTKKNIETENEGGKGGIL